MDLPHSTHIYWNLLPGKVELFYNSAPLAEGAIILDKSSLLYIAEKIALIPHDFLHIIFSGSEPLLHPFLPVLANYFAYAGKNIRITLELGGKYAPAIHKWVLDMAKCGIMDFTIYVDTQMSMLQQTLTLIALLSNNGFNVRVVPYFLRGERSENQLLTTALNKMISICQFELNDFRKDPRTQFHSFWEQNHKLPIIPERNSFLCAANCGYLQINSGGVVQGLPCDRGSSICALWETDDLLLCHFIRCDKINCPALKLWGVPRAYDLAEAQRMQNAWEKDFTGKGYFR